MSDQMTDLSQLTEIVDEPAAPAPPFSLRIHHCSISVPDIEAAIAWYREMLGFSVEYRMMLPAGPTKGAFLRRGAVRVEVFEQAGSLPLPAERGHPDTDNRIHGTKHMALEVSDIIGALEFLTARGVEIALPLFHGGGLMGCFIRDNSGIIIELIEHRDVRRTI